MARALVAWAVLCIGSSTYAQPSEVQRYITVPYEGREGLKKLVEQGFEVGGVNLEKKQATLIVKDTDMVRTRSLRVLSSRPIGRPDSAYQTPAKVEAALLKAENDYPHLVTVEKFGNTVQGLPMYVARITAKMVFNPEGKKSILFDCMHHAREVMTSEVGLDIVDYLTKNYATDPKVQNWVNNYDIWVVPMVNPDGNNQVWKSDAMWRKNMQGGYGVDVNRNYPAAWNTCNGSSGNKSSETYRGPSAGSEPETQALMALATRVRPKFNISYHSFSEIVIFPYGCSPKKIPSPDRAIYEGYARDLAKRLVRDSGTGSYTAGTSYELLYNVDGGSIDWMYDHEKIMSFVVEMNGDSLGFQPSYSQWRKKTVERQRAGWQYLLDQMEGPGIR